MSRKKKKPIIEYYRPNRPEVRETRAAQVVALSATEAEVAKTLLGDQPVKEDKTA